MLKQDWRLLLCVLALWGLAGCSSQPEESDITTYLLPQATEQTVPAILNRQPVLVVSPVEMALHLTGTGLVYQTSETAIVQAQQNLWAEDVSRQLTRRIQGDLRMKQTRYWPSELSAAIQSTGLPKLQVRVSEFNGHYSGLAHFSGEWLLVSQQGELQTIQPFSVQVPLKAAGYSAQVSALSEAVSRLTTQIAQRLSTASLYQSD
ncbi:membrane integrity-associated transporter subunit PqiC [Photobacterium sp. 1_MG-2023]|uniref:PqiC family protein n=1 Tax=Photobacterium sp. 1_MG-2023 TaxID=3062646 RepID=UPI0026E13333|nr:ABC-type transport auxiliary lipoprotein family protein [Photobacterium sp. 1_MG-2023]MDO6705869.1 ABC-type transport auxiliary lipoprotein family protein [Photobacterium sp. 1_MG-2023]